MPMHECIKTGTNSATNLLFIAANMRNSFDK